MSTSEEMAIDERLKYLRLMRGKYKTASRKEKGRMLGDMMTVTGYNRKYLIGLLGGDLERHLRRSRRGRTYGPEVDGAWRTSWGQVIPPAGGWRARLPIGSIGTSWRCTVSVDWTRSR